jgi:hypothetical protein
MSRACMWRPLWSSGSALVPIFILFTCNSYQKMYFTFIQLSDCEYISVYRCHEAKFVTYVSKTASFYPHTASTDQARWGFYHPQYHNITRMHIKCVTKQIARLFYQSDVWRKDGCSEFDFRQCQRVISLPPREDKICGPLSDTVRIWTLSPRARKPELEANHLSWFPQWLNEYQRHIEVQVRRKGSEFDISVNYFRD